MPPATPSELTLAAKIFAHESWARTGDRSARTAPARDAFLRGFERLVDPNSTLNAAEREARANEARSAHFRELARRSVASRGVDALSESAIDQIACILADAPPLSPEQRDRLGVLLNSPRGGDPE